MHSSFKSAVLSQVFHCMFCVYVFSGVPSALSRMGAAAVAVSEAGCFIRGPAQDPGRTVHSNAGDVKRGQSARPVYSTLI